VTGPANGDAFGDMLRTAFRSPAGTVTEIVERSDGYIYALRPERYFTAPREWTSFERAALAAASGEVLDVGCGAGRFALALQDAGVPVTALDISAGAVAVSRERGVRDAVHATVRDLAGRGRRYDTFLLMGENLGLLEGTARAAGFLGELAAIARPGARIIGHGADPHAAGDPALTSYLLRERPPGQLPGEMTIRVRFRHLVTDWFGYLLCSAAELGGLTSGTPWKLMSADYADRANYLAVLTLR
jgi:SAM-dependent methyltransferase